MPNLMKKALLSLLPWVLLIDLPAATPSPLAAPPKYVTDYAGVLRTGTADRLSSQLADFDHRTANELIIAIYPNIPKGVLIGDYARQLYAAWKIGKRGKDTGALLVIATQEHLGRIQAGRGLEAKLTLKPSVKKSLRTELHPDLTRTITTAPARLLRTR